MAMVSMGPELLQLWQPKGIGKDPPSLSTKTCTLKIMGGEEAITLPVYTNTKVFEVKGLLNMKMGLEDGQLVFCAKQGASIRVFRDHEECPRTVLVKGIRSFTREKKQYDHPHAIIGAGHLGLKVAMSWLTVDKPPMTNFVLFDRKDRVGGTSWIDQANRTSRLQTEVGVYHLQYHPDNDWPVEAIEQPWPSRDWLLDHFAEVSQRYGIMPYCRMETNVTKMSVIGREYNSQTYELTLEHKGMESLTTVSSICFFPGNLTLPKRVTYPGEETFDGDIVYGISSLFDYERCTGANVCIVGSGAFAVENVRTCVEYSAKKVYMVCRRKTISMPRVVSWLINQSYNMVSAALTLEAASPMYDLIGVDQWKYYSVYANEARTTVNIRQKSRFGIGDVYFLGMWYGYVDHIVDDIKRVGPHRIHLISGRVLEDTPVMLKLLGFNGEFENDRLLKIKELFGWWANKDHRRYVVAEPLGVDASNFGGTSFSPGAIMWAEQHTYLMNYPKDWGYIMDSGMLPTHVADESIDRPAYVVEARHGSSTGIALSSLVPGFAELGAKYGTIKHDRMWQMHPLEQFLKCAKREWDAWGKNIKEVGGFEQEIPEYPYTKEIVEEYIKKEIAAYG